MRLLAVKSSLVGCWIVDSAEGDMISSRTSGFEDISASLGSSRRFVGFSEGGDK